jgi:DNA-binding IclR family transcriptional regulator
MAYTYEELRKKTIDDLREIAKGVEHDAVKGYTQMNKEHLLPALCKALGIEGHGHHDVVGIDKAKVKAKIRQLKAEREKAIEAHDHAQLKQIRRQMHHLKRRIRAATV